LLRGFGFLTWGKGKSLPDSGSSPKHPKIHPLQFDFAI
jgi:hypothetical protein